MKAAVYRGAGRIDIDEVPTPRPGPGELLLKVTAVGICGTDAHEFDSGPHMFPDHPFIPGHEFAGQVVGVGTDVEGFVEGDLVASGAGISCGECRWCRRGATNLCPEYVTLGLQLSGGLAEYVVAPADICMEVRSLGLSPDVAALAQPMSIAVHATRRGRVDSHDVVVVIGAGGIGAFLTYALTRVGAEIHVVDLDDDRLEVAGSLGATSTMRPDDDRPPPPSVIYEATGGAPGLDFALESAVPGTRVVVLGLQDGPTNLDLRSLSLGELELIGTNAHSFPTDFPEATRLLAARCEGWSDVAPVALPLHDLVDEGLRPMIEGRTKRIKTLIDPSANEPRSTR